MYFIDGLFILKIKKKKTKSRKQKLHWVLERMLHTCTSGPKQKVKRSSKLILRSTLIRE